MYNIYSERKRLLELNKKEREKKSLLKNNKLHKIKMQKLALNYEKRLKDFIIEVRFLLIMELIL